MKEIVRGQAKSAADARGKCSKNPSDRDLLLRHPDAPSTDEVCVSKGDDVNFFDSVVLELIPRPLLLKREGGRRAYRGKIPLRKRGT